MFKNGNVVLYVVYRLMNVMCKCSNLGNDLGSMLRHFPVTFEKITKECDLEMRGKVHFADLGRASLF
jgi:hypothetical protein